ncbi:MAG: alpha/beta hydrolase [Phycisphaerales bacterium]|nr:alpha/beta hydrolase [Phycisphaerales bacterium]
MPGPATTHEDLSIPVWGASLAARRIRLPSPAPTAPIVFLHDSLGCISAWRDFPDRLCAAAGREGLVYDREGFGRSTPLARPRTRRYLHDEADILTELMTAAGIDQAVLFGHSDGATIALLAAALAPDRVPAVVSIGAHVLIEPQTRAGLRDALPWWDDPRFRASMTRHHADKAEAVFRVWTETWLSEQFAGWNMLDELALVRCPTLVIQGERDEYASPGHVGTIVQRVAGPTEGWVIPGRGHTPYREGPEVLDRTLGFLLTR